MSFFCIKNTLSKICFKTCIFISSVYKRCLEGLKFILRNISKMIEFDNMNSDMK